MIGVRGPDAPIIKPHQSVLARINNGSIKKKKARGASISSLFVVDVVVVAAAVVVAAISAIGSLILYISSVLFF